MNTLLIIGILALVLVGAGAAVYMSTMNTGQGNSNTSTTTSTTTSTASQTTSISGGGSGSTTTTTGETVNITGPWYGTYTTSNGLTGRWAWRIWKTGPNSYKGLLVTTEPYKTGGPVPITITLEGNKITVGAVSVGATFTGTINGDHMSGTWSLANGMDHGTWSGQRGETDITPQE